MKVRNEATGLLKELELTSQRSGSTKRLESQLGHVIGSTKNVSQNPLKRVHPEYSKERIPDTEHLARMRALLVAAHQNDNFIKKLAAGNSYIPENINPAGSQEEMGQSFQDLFSKRNKKLQKELDKADAKMGNIKVDEDGTLIPEELVGSSTYSSDEATSLQTQERLDQMGINEEELVRVITQDID